MKAIMLFFTIFAPVIFVAQGQALIDCYARNLPKNCNEMEEFKTQSPPPAPLPKAVACKDAVKAYLSKADIMRLVQEASAAYNASIDKMGSEQLIPEPIDPKKETDRIISDFQWCARYADQTEKDLPLGQDEIMSEQALADESIQLQKQYIHAYVEDKKNKNFLDYYKAKYRLSCPSKDACANKPISKQLELADKAQHASFFKLVHDSEPMFHNRLKLNKAQSFRNRYRTPYDITSQDCMVQ